MSSWFTLSVYRWNQACTCFVMLCHLSEHKLKKIVMRLSSKICKACLTCTQNIFSWPPTLRASAPLLLESMRQWIQPCLINKRRRGFGWRDSYLSENTAQTTLPDRRSCRFWGMEFSRGGKGKSKDNDIVHSLSLCLISRLSGRLSFGRSGCRSDKGPLNPPGILMTQLHRRRC